MGGGLAEGGQSGVMAVMHGLLAELDPIGGDGGQHAERCLGVPSLVGVRPEGDIGADGLADEPDALDIAVAVLAELHLDGLHPARHEVLRSRGHAFRLVDPDGEVCHDRPAAATQVAVERDAGLLGRDVVQGHVECALDGCVARDVGVHLRHPGLYVEGVLAFD